MATRQWAVSANGTYDFNTAANWTFGVVPSAIDVTQFNTGAVDTITGNATIAEILVSQGVYFLSGTYTISGAQATELAITSSGSHLTIASGASVSGNQSVSVSGGTLEIQGTLAASSLTINGNGAVYVDPGAGFGVTGPIAISDGGIIARLAPGQAPGAPI